MSPSACLAIPPARPPRRSFLFLSLALALLLTGALPALAQDPVVTAAVPDTTEQATYDLVVTISGSNFGTDSVVDFYVTGTTDPGGITVKKVRRRNPKTLEATIDVAADAQFQYKFDIQVRTGGRTGKGTELFKVTLKKLGTADPVITFLEGSAVQVANRDGSNKVTIYSNKNAYIGSLRMSSDRRHVVFAETPLRGGQSAIRRATFEVVNGFVVAGRTETLLVGVPMLIEVAPHPLDADGTRFAFVRGGAIYEVWKERDCPDSPCDVSSFVDPLYASPELGDEGIGAYSANGRALYFEEGGDPQIGVSANLMRLEFGTEPGDPVVASLVLADMPFGLYTFQTSRIDYSAAPYGYGPFETRLLVDGESTEPYETGLRTYDTWDGTLTDLLPTGHHATWSPDERVIFYLNRWQNATNWLRGRLMMYDRDTGVFVQIDDFSGYPDWAPPLR